MIFCSSSCVLLAEEQVVLASCRSCLRNFCVVASPSGTAALRALSNGCLDLLVGDLDVLVARPRPRATSARIRNDMTWLLQLLVLLLALRLVAARRSASADPWPASARSPSSGDALGEVGRVRDDDLRRPAWPARRARDVQPAVEVASSRSTSPSTFDHVAARDASRRRRRRARRGDKKRRQAPGRDGDLVHRRRSVGG